VACGARWRVVVGGSRVRGLVLRGAGEAKLTLVTNAKGGIIDDSVITNHGDYM
jgi:glycine cleavage system aminomethyltransferase T